jgi:hypothetical protein
VGSAKCTRAFLIAPIRLVHMPLLSNGCRYVCVLKPYNSLLLFRCSKRLD